MNSNSLYCRIPHFKNTIAQRGGRVKETVFGILKFLAGLAFVVFSFYLHYKRIEQRAKDLGNGGIQTLFGDQKRK